MQPWLVVLALPFCLHSASSRESRTFPCPEHDAILPCVCNHEAAIDEVHVDCSEATTSTQILTAFHEGFWPFDNLTEFRLKGYRKVSEIPEEIFGYVSFRRIFVETTDVVFVDQSAFLSCRDDLAHLSFWYGHLERFPWQSLPQFVSLAILNLEFNEITAIDSFESPSLVTLRVSNNRIATLKTGISAPNLNALIMNNNPISTIPSRFFEGMENLEEFQCQWCNLGPAISDGSMEFRSQTLKSVYLRNNIISSFEPGGISVVSPDAVVDLEANQITELTESIFRPVMDFLARGNGLLNVWDNPIVCGCSMAWVMLDPIILERVYGSCVNGTLFQELDPHHFEAFC
ncbi:unnamed protein product [Darwinula stevensoni]|uniref:Oplophorus-luciferin 2-monooxygenase non-catalytic subunit n=1 Tax=Darwinula stevensoni TaxID=69355 RepID=A0A7R8XCD9_9CRUS|nr:unnamed protein product [Darwinula stevensoni]CAG0891884.1 unnamed protein product [Darwinula stevensoni]